MPRQPMTAKPVGHADLLRMLGRVCREVREGEPLRKHVSFRVGGPADLLVVPRSREELRAVVTWLFTERVPFVVLGQGSNVVISDLGIRGIVLKIGKGLDRITLDGDRVTAQAGAGLPHLARAAAVQGLSGLEFAAGIPASLGGAVVMNAGAHAGRLIDLAGGKGLQVGGAQVSEVHANYIVNTGAASATDVVALMHKVNALVAEKFGVELEPEIKLLGEFEPA